MQEMKPIKEGKVRGNLERIGEVPTVKFMTMETA